MLILLSSATIMAASVLFACGLNGTKLPTLVHVSEESNVDGSFLISSILCQRLRISNVGTLLVCLQHGYQHYTKAGMRLGYDCNVFVGKTLSVLDPLTDIARDFPVSNWLISGDTNIADVLLQEIKKQIMGTNFSVRTHNTIIIDNLAILYNLGASKEDVQMFFNDLMHLTKQMDNLSLITKMSNSDIFCVEDSNISKCSLVHVNVLNLKSGLFHEVDGKLLIKRCQDENDDNCDWNVTTKEVLYKVNERNIKIYNPGEIGIKA
ncbi:uncharacterized protein LOC119634793 isoform X3 [Glossina fuscipes]|uniref:Elongator complex protein 6 n=1 Tax=Glossina fuscipes TaxID=7396 RepID=A0A8U0WH82_9MUSC|nr:uncharacterized protein LOC119634793 isoform X3 [Glossina fuscipes]